MSNGITHMAATLTAKPVENAPLPAKRRPLTKRVREYLSEYGPVSEHDLFAAFSETPDQLREALYQIKAERHVLWGISNGH